MQASLGELTTNLAAVTRREVAAELGAITKNITELNNQMSCQIDSRDTIEDIKSLMEIVGKKLDSGGVTQEKILKQLSTMEKTIDKVGSKIDELHLLTLEAFGALDIPRLMLMVPKDAKKDDSSFFLRIKGKAIKATTKLGLTQNFRLYLMCDGPPKNKDFTKCSNVHPGYDILKAGKIRRLLLLTFIVKLNLYAFSR